MGRATIAPPRPVPAPELIKAQAYALGFDLAGIAKLGPAGTFPAFEQWLARGMAGEMRWLSRDAALRRDTRLPSRGARSAIVVALDYGGRQPPGTLARYARGRDYHSVMKERLWKLAKWLETETASKVSARTYVDTGPILERDLARLAGLGWFGKNTLLIHPRRGSFLFLGALFVNLELEPDTPFTEEHCGTCTRCIDACPTEAEDHLGSDPNDGCPLPPDKDGDGIPDRYDQCPDAPEDKDGVDDGDGCPEDDADTDGIPDAQDACPKEPGPRSSVSNRSHPVAA